MSLNEFYDKYKKVKRTSSLQFHENLASYLEKVFAIKDGVDTGLFTEAISKEIFQPDDYCRVVENRKEMSYRLLYQCLAMGRLEDAAICLVHILRQHYPNICIIWRAGFHVLQQLCAPQDMHDFFSAVLKVAHADHSNMVYEYMLYLIAIEDYDRVSDTYTHPSVLMIRSSRAKKADDGESKHVWRLVKLTVATACYLQWRRLVQGGEGLTAEAKHARDSAVSHYAYLYELIEEGEMVDSYVVCYSDLLRARGRLADCVALLRLYRDKCEHNVTATQLLLDFLSKEGHALGEAPEDIDGEIAALRLHLGDYGRV